MNLIPIKQNTPDELRKLLVEDKNYSTAKVWHGTQIVAVVFITSILSLVAVIYEKIGPYAAVYGALVTLFDFFFLDPNISKSKQLAASVRECFDVNILQLDPSPFRNADIPIEETVAIPDPLPLAKNKNKVNWYPPIVGSIPIEAARLICQRSSMQYDDRLRVSYNKAWFSVLSFLSIAFLVWLCLKNPQFYRVAIIAAAILPAGLFCIKQIQLNAESRNKIKKMREYFDNVWKTALKPNYNSEQLTSSARQIQDQLFDHRGQRPLVFDFYYNFHRSTNERIMNDSAQSYVHSYKQAHNLQ